MTETKKITREGHLERLLEIVTPIGTEEDVNFLKHELELVRRKKENKGTSKVQVENEKVLAMLIEELGKFNEPITITDLMNKSEVVKNYTLDNGNVISNQKITYLFNHTDKVVRVVDKKKTYFSVREVD